MAQKKKIKINNRPRQKVFRLCKLFFYRFLSVCVFLLQWNWELRVEIVSLGHHFLFSFVIASYSGWWSECSEIPAKESVCMSTLEGFFFQFLFSPLLMAANWLLSWMLAGKEARGCSQFEWAVGFIRSQSTLCYCRWQLFFQVSLLYASSNPSWP
jgi:hypothetical protein